MELLPEQEENNDDVSDLPALPISVRMKDGQLVDTASNKWRVRSPKRGTYHTINWDRLEGSGKRPVLSVRARHLVKLYMIYSLSKRVWTTTLECFTSLVSFERWLKEQFDSSPPTQKRFDWGNLDERSIRAFQIWRSKQTVRAGHTLSHLRSFYAWGIARHYPDFSHDMLSVLRTVRGIPTPRGQNVRLRHPLKGPLSPEEVLLVRRAVKENQGEDQDRALVMLHLELGMNPYANVQLLNRDFRRYDVAGKLYYQLDVPQVKKRTVHRDTKRRPISHDLGALLEKIQQGGPEEPLLYWLAPSGPEKAIRDAMRRFAKAANLISPVTSTLLKLYPRRFRYTLATYMAEEGASKYHIAEILDHTDLQHAHVYVETVSSIAESVAKATDADLQPIVNRFLGKIIESPEKADGKETASAVIPAIPSHLPLPVLNVSGVGMCGRDVRKDGLCRLFPPLSCYLCPSFAALRTGPHKELLESLDTFVTEMQGAVDQRILKQLDDIRGAIKEVLTQLQLTPGTRPKMTGGGDENL